MYVLYRRYKFQGLVKRISKTGESLSETIQMRLFLGNIGWGYETWVSFNMTVSQVGWSMGRE
jgi:hypothetical protein